MVLATLELMKDVQYALKVPIMIRNLQEPVSLAHQDKIHPRKEAPEEQIVIKLVRKH